MKCIIVEDDNLSATLLQSLLESNYSIELSGIFSTVNDAKNHLKKEKIDLIFLDVQLPDESGFELIRNSENPPLFIIISSFKQFGPEAFEFEAVDSFNFLRLKFNPETGNSMVTGTSSANAVEIPLQATPKPPLIIGGYSQPNIKTPEPFITYQPLKIYA